MNNKGSAPNVLNLSGAVIRKAPFPHFALQSVLSAPFGEALLRWFESDAPWAKQEIDGFYELHNLDILSLKLPVELSIIKEPSFLLRLGNTFGNIFKTSMDSNVRVDAHKLSQGRRIRVHTDHGDTAITHRLVIQVNRGWAKDHGGLLIFMPDRFATDLSDEHAFYPPYPFSAVGFEISPVSYHAVSPVEIGIRYTLCFSFVESPMSSAKQVSQDILSRPLRLAEKRNK